MQSRRDFLASTSSAVAAGLVGPRVAFANEPPPEMTTLRLPREPNICPAPQYIAEDLLRAEGFTAIRYVENTAVDAVARGAIDFDLFAAPVVITLLDAGAPVTALAGVHSGCYELFAHDPIRTLSDLRGKRIAIRRQRRRGPPAAHAHGRARRSGPAGGHRLDC
jgi:NitT/TauT family transport system substrate-binding protein